MPTRLFYVGMWTQADREGRMEDRPKRLKAVIMPYDNVQVEKILEDLTKARFIIRYKAGGRPYIQIRTFTKHQRVNMREPASTIPAPTDDMQADEITCTHVQADESTWGREGKGMEGKYTSCTETLETRSVPLASPEPVLTLPTVNPPAEYPIDQPQIDQWQGAFPAVDVLQELRTAREWCLAHPTRCKTRRGVKAFCVSWLSRAQDRAKGNGSGVGPALPRAPDPPPIPLPPEEAAWRERYLKQGVT